MKDRIKRIMESQHMTQQTFAQFLQQSPATLSNILNDKTKASLAFIEAVKSKLPAISTDWLMFGTGPMYLDGKAVEPSSAASSGEARLDFGEPLLDTPAPSVAARTVPAGFQEAHRGYGSGQRVDNVIMKNFDKQARKITEIRLFYDDQTWETFVPKK